MSIDPYTARELPPLQAGPLLPEKLPEDAYIELCEDLADEQPFEGFAAITDLRPLSDAERAIALRAMPDLLNGIEFDAEALAAIFNAPETSLLGVYLNLGHHAFRQLDDAIRAQVLQDVQEECEARREADERDRTAEECRRTGLSIDELNLLDAGVPDRIF